MWYFVIETYNSKLSCKYYDISLKGICCKVKKMEEVCVKVTPEYLWKVKEASHYGGEWSLCFPFVVCVRLFLEKYLYQSFSFNMIEKIYLYQSFSFNMLEKILLAA